MKISVVCAPQTFGCNAGMFSVDLAAWYFLRKHFPHAHITYSTLYPHRCDFGRAAPFRYASQQGELQVLRDSDVILFWGDFLQGLHYRNVVAAQLVAQGVCSSADEALGKVRSYLFLGGSTADLLEKAVLYGGTLLFNTLDSYQDQCYLDDLKRLLRSARRVWVREPFSAFHVNQLQGRVEPSCSHGTDCAQLLGADFIDYCPVGAKGLRTGGQKGLGLFIGRSHLHTERVAAFVSALGSSMQIGLSWLDWGRPPFFIDKRDELLGGLPQALDNADRNAPALTPLEALVALRGCDFLISDTYHACVNAWNFGIPAICVIDDSDLALAVNRGARAGNRDKRVVFYWTYNAAPFLVYASELSCESAIREKAMDIASLLNNRAVVAQVRMQMLQHTRMAGNALARTLRG